MIKLLRSHGYSFPFRMDTSVRSRRLNSDFDDTILQPMEVVLRSHCPPYVLELLLQDFQSRHDVLWGLFLDLTDESFSWVEQHHREAADTFEKKVELLVKYQATTGVEERILKSFVKSLRCLDISTKLQGVTDSEAQFCWNTLCDALRPFILGAFQDDNELRGEFRDSGHYLFWFGQYGSDSDRSTFGRRIHGFSLDHEWPPHTRYYDYQLQNDSIRAKMSNPWGTEGSYQGRDGKWYDREWYRVTNKNCEYERSTTWPCRIRGRSVMRSTVSTGEACGRSTMPIRTSLVLSGAVSLIEGNEGELDWVRIKDVMAETF
ncbi:hypothetical protein F53441_8110 [Fusarium austroafricanum]|uniref:Uncharacterized protein n=1 Tax=Fusarium austroafricanum TaxID=2364996 RepID=A0A8H4KG65_9HYPO|nr:hypothetical protein F53441_8110 [Fusarium austroafricanum]